MKKIMLAAMLLISACTFAQTAKRLPDGNFVSTSKEKAPPKNTGKTFTDKDGKKYPVYVNGNGKFFVIKLSKKTKKEYRSYLKIEA